jgi:hypothetical protein
MGQLPDARSTSPSTLEMLEAAELAGGTPRVPRTPPNHIRTRTGTGTGTGTGTEL